MELTPEQQFLLDLVQAQAKDEGLWFVSETVNEEYLQQHLRDLHRAVENAFDCTNN